MLQHGHTHHTLISKQNNIQHHRTTTTTTMFPSTSIHHRRFWVMFGCTYPAMALFRIGLNLLVTMELLSRFTYLPSFYSNGDTDGTLPISLLWNKVDPLYQFILCFPYSYCYGDLFQQQVLLGVQVAISIAITLGFYGSNTLCFISWYLYFTLTLRNTWLSYILDRYIHYLLFLSIFLPHYECYSIHSYLRSLRQRKKRVLYTSSRSRSSSESLVYLTSHDRYETISCLDLFRCGVWKI